MRSKSKRNPERAARTRTLIQMGGLLDLAGFKDFFQINQGEDLESNINSLDKAATLLGCLVHAFEQADNSDEAKQKWLHKGKRLLKNQYSRIAISNE